jgi:hypothetical protein
VEPGAVPVDLRAAQRDDERAVAVGVDPAARPGVEIAAASARAGLIAASAASIGVPATAGVGCSASARSSADVSPVADTGGDHRGEVRKIGERPPARFVDVRGLAERRECLAHRVDHETCSRPSLSEPRGSSALRAGAGHSGARSRPAPVRRTSSSGLAPTKPWSA